MAMVELRAPLDGVSVPLEQLPDPVFSRWMVKEDLSIDPISQLTQAAIANGEGVAELRVGKGWGYE